MQYWREASRQKKGEEFRRRGGRKNSVLPLSVYVCEIDYCFHTHLCFHPPPRPISPTSRHISLLSFNDASRCLFPSVINSFSMTRRWQWFNRKNTYFSSSSYSSFSPSTGWHGNVSWKNHAQSQGKIHVTFLCLQNFSPFLPSQLRKSMTMPIERKVNFQK